MRAVGRSRPGEEGGKERTWDGKLQGGAPPHGDPSLDYDAWFGLGVLSTSLFYFIMRLRVWLLARPSPHLAQSSPPTSMPHPS